MSESERSERDRNEGAGAERGGSERSERERIRERKRRELRERLEAGANDGSDGTGGTHDDGAGGTHDDGAGGTHDDGAGESGAGGGTPDHPVEVGSAEEFQRLVGEHDVVLVDCYADWCGPCRMMEPTVESLAAETHAVVAKVDVDGLPGLAQRLGARGVPTFLLYANGEPVDRFVGAQDRTTLETAIANGAA